jgi:hypothetical protein
MPFAGCETVGNWSEPMRLWRVGFHWFSLETEGTPWSWSFCGNMRLKLISSSRSGSAHQHEIVSELECAGRNSRQARKLRREFEACLTLQVADRDRLHQQLGL